MHLVASGAGHLGSDQANWLKLHGKAAKQGSFSGLAADFQRKNVNCKGYSASLEVGKLYRMIPDEEAAAHGYIRIIDESGEDYAFTANRFHVVSLPQSVGQVLLAASRT